MPLAHPLGEQSEREAAGPSVVLDTFAGRVHVEWEPAAPVTALGHLPFFVADSSLEGNTGAFFSMIGVGDLVQQSVEDLVGSSVSMALARS